VTDTAARTDSIVLPAEKTRVVVLGDPHGDLIGLAEVLAREKRPEAALFSAGDNVGYADGASCSALCRTLAREGIASVQGNHEAWSSSGKLFLVTSGAPDRLADDALAWCLELPYRIRIASEAAPGLSIGIVHTLPDWEYVNESNAEHLVAQEGSDVTFVGHSHAPAVYAVRDTKVSVKRLHPNKDFPLRVPLEPGVRYVVDTGSLARPGSRDKRPRMFLERGTYAALDLRERVVRVYAFDKRKRLEELLRREIEENTRRARASGESSP
jgi:predicted phosphodiesterase